MRYIGAFECCDTISMYLSNSAIPACYLLTLKHPLRTITNALDLFVSLLHHLLHLLLRLLQVVRQHIAIQLKFPQLLVVFLTPLLYQLVCSLRSFDGRLDGCATRFSRWRWERYLDGEWVRRFGRERRERVR